MRSLALFALTALSVLRCPATAAAQYDFDAGAPPAVETWVTYDGPDMDAAPTAMTTTTTTTTTSPDVGPIYGAPRELEAPELPPVVELETTYAEPIEQEPDPSQMVCWVDPIMMPPPPVMPPPPPVMMPPPPPAMRIVTFCENASSLPLTFYANGALCGPGCCSVALPDDDARVYLEVDGAPGTFAAFGSCPPISTDGVFDFGWSDLDPLYSWPAPDGTATYSCMAHLFPAMP